ncbi:LLM class F420-dependent oxidoreductase [Ornithinimicrobium cryptoxanthini]|uniref:LLM class F420-dependent oxidoreductase n=1 Tax=Ornithinimicrobium cryptoxanthini TaxID=2934161 RepID=A0ABY4YEQ7_9MICO|nr:LLM class F420-dependent oxidoreductase [Ornithinimicrobium cryptoxanthini]USQ74838.1 LLM class F420-dependent oxidoreductase [Ornithinimicrobium cryptoxanthini]
MRLGLSCGWWGIGQDQDHLALVRRAEELGVHVVWASEAYGVDAVTVLSWIGAQTSRIRLGAGVLQIPGRTPAMTAMTAAGLSSLSNGRFDLGLGVSGPQVSEGWHGVRFAKPLERTREYVEIVRMALARQRVEFHGNHFELPLPDGPGKALRSSAAPSEHQVPIYLAAVGPKNLELTGEIADGWLAIFFNPDLAGEQMAQIEDGRSRSAEPERAFAVDATVPLSVNDDVSAAADAVRGYASLYVGGMGSRTQNFYNALAVRMGYAEAAAQVQDLYLAGRHRDAAAAVPQQFIDDTSLLGPQGRLAERLQRYADAGVTTVTFAPYGDTLEERVGALETGVAAAEQAGLL